MEKNLARSELENVGEAIPDRGFKDGCAQGFSADYKDTKLMMHRDHAVAIGQVLSSCATCASTAFHVTTEPRERSLGVVSQRQRRNWPGTTVASKGTARETAARTRRTLPTNHLRHTTTRGTRTTSWRRKYHLQQKKRHRQGVGNAYLGPERHHRGLDHHHQRLECHHHESQPIIRPGSHLMLRTESHLLRRLGSHRMYCITRPPTKSPTKHRGFLPPRTPKGNIRGETPNTCVDFAYQVHH